MSMYAMLVGLVAIGGGFFFLSWRRIRRFNRWKDQVDSAIRIWQVGDVRGATVELERLLEEAQYAWGQDSLRVAFVLNPLSQCYEAAQLGEKALATCEREWTIVQKRLGTGHEKTISILNDLTTLALQLDRMEQAEQWGREALMLGNNVLPAQHVEKATAQKNFALVLLLQDRWTDAEPLLLEAMESYRLLYGPEDPDVVALRDILIHEYYHREQISQAIVYVQQTLSYHRKHSGANDPETIHTAKFLVSLLSQEERWEEAALLTEQYREQLEHVGVQLPP